MVVCNICGKVVKTTQGLAGHMRLKHPTAPTPFSTQSIQTTPSPSVSIQYPTPQVSGDIAAKSFRLFEEGVNPIEVVAKLRITPEQSEYLFNKYMDLRDLQEQYDNLLIEIEDLRNEKRELIFCRDQAVEQLNSVAKILKRGRYCWVKIISKDFNEWVIVPVS